MKKLKRAISIISMVFILGMTTISVSAAETSQLTLAQANQFAMESNDEYIEDSFEELLDASIESGTQECNIGVIENTSGEDDFEVHTYVVQNEELSTDNNMKSKLRAITYASEITLKNSEGHKYEEGMDGAYYVRAYSTIYYSSIDNDGNNLSCLTKVTGGYTNDVGVRVTNQSITYGMSGFTLGGVCNISDTKRPTSQSFSYNTGFTEYVATSSSSYIGCTTTLVIQRGTGNYTFVLYNNM